jgi:hypothetical protein
MKALACTAPQLWWVHRGAEGGDQELWHGTQMWFWMAPNHVRAMAKVAVSESRLLRALLRRAEVCAVAAKPWL